jgi:hypothetical protein
MPPTLHVGRLVGDVGKNDRRRAWACSLDYALFVYGVYEIHGKATHRLVTCRTQSGSPSIHAGIHLPPAKLTI